MTLRVKGAGKGAAPSSFSLAQHLLSTDCTHVATASEHVYAAHCPLCIAEVIDEAVRRALMHHGHVAPEDQP